ncbi:MAG: threonine synthase [Rhodospirillaceae bacterium]|nr:threonine synthase [Rhodospirillaceae bacterium]MBT5192981.1 threonine synthase [Rhodospirillaceae bacterium]MBT5896949.1 threonine synthase [Rhodospirillaceae bacterium]MBT7758831.1 threonine synthase [Rhodospirillaceae bacterium]
MQYISTRGQAPDLDFGDVLLTGLARDGGLYVPSDWPQLSHDDLRGLAGLPYSEAAARILQPFMDGIGGDELLEMTRAAYTSFADPGVVPLRQLSDGHWLMELFHGPTLAFKDVAMQLLGRLFDRELSRQQRRVTIVGATSGDTGSAAIEACKDRDAIDIFILYPHGRVTEVQRRQMTTVLSDNVHNIAIEGTFDDCQALVKAAFNDLAFRDEISMSAVNSINWARVVAQVVYYITTAVALGAPDRKVSFAVPTGNFGCVFAGYAAARMGLPMDKLIVSTNRNDILYRFFQTGSYRMDQVVATQSPSMDIQVASNFERLLFDLADRDGGTVRRQMAELAEQGGFEVPPAALQQAHRIFRSHRVDEAATTATIGDVYRDNGIIIDPHTAVGLRAALDLVPDGPVITLATAHPAKFPDAVEKACGIRPPLPAHLTDLYEREERYATLPNDLATLQDHIRGLRRN